MMSRRVPKFEVCTLVLVVSCILAIIALGALQNSITPKTQIVSLLAKDALRTSDVFGRRYARDSERDHGSHSMDKKPSPKHGFLPDQKSHSLNGKTSPDHAYKAAKRKVRHNSSPSSTHRSPKKSLPNTVTFGNTKEIEKSPQEAKSSKPSNRLSSARSQVSSLSSQNFISKRKRSPGSVDSKMTPEHSETINVSSKYEKTSPSPILPGPKFSYQRGVTVSPGGASKLNNSKSTKKNFPGKHSEAKFSSQQFEPKSLQHPEVNTSTKDIVSMSLNTSIKLSKMNSLPKHSKSDSLHKHSKVDLSLKHLVINSSLNHPESNSSPNHFKANSPSDDFKMNPVPNPPETNSSLNHSNAIILSNHSEVKSLSENTDAKSPLKHSKTTSLPRDSMANVSINEFRKKNASIKHTERIAMKKQSDSLPDLSPEDISSIGPKGNTSIKLSKMNSLLKHSKSDSLHKHSKVDLPLNHNETNSSLNHPPNHFKANSSYDDLKINSVPNRPVSKHEYGKKNSSIKDERIALKKQSDGLLDSPPKDIISTSPKGNTSIKLSKMNLLPKHSKSDSLHRHSKIDLSLNHPETNSSLNHPESNLLPNHFKANSPSDDLKINSLQNHPETNSSLNHSKTKPLLNHFDVRSPLKLSNMTSLSRDSKANVSTHEFRKENSLTKHTERISLKKESNGPPANDSPFVHNMAIPSPKLHSRINKISSNTTSSTEHDKYSGRTSNNSRSNSSMNSPTSLMPKHSKTNSLSTKTENNTSHHKHLSTNPPSNNSLTNLLLLRHSKKNDSISLHSTVNVPVNHLEADMLHNDYRGQVRSKNVEVNSVPKHSKRNKLPKKSKQNVLYRKQKVAKEANSPNLGRNTPKVNSSSKYSETRLRNKHKKAPILSRDNQKLTAETADLKPELVRSSVFKTFGKVSRYTNENLTPQSEHQNRISKFDRAVEEKDLNEHNKRMLASSKDNDRWESKRFNKQALLGNNKRDLLPLQRENPPNVDVTSHGSEHPQHVSHMETKFERTPESRESRLEKQKSNPIRYKNP